MNQNCEKRKMKYTVLKQLYKGSVIARLPYVRAVLLLITVSSCVTVNFDLSLLYSWRGILAALCFAGTYIVTWIFESTENASINSTENPFKGRKGKGYLTDQEEARVNAMITESVVYNAASVPSLERFKAISSKTECIFARRAKIWGSLDIDISLSLEENIRRMVPTFYKFTLVFQELGLDAFVIELPGDIYGSDIKIFRCAVKQVLLTLREADLERQRRRWLPEHGATLATGYPLDSADVANRRRYLGPEDPACWARSSWVFEYNKVTFFLTSFAPFYPRCNSRFGFGAHNCYILFQPELSFAIHDLPPDTAETNWLCPVTVRDKIRVAFHDAGREYQLPKATQLPMIYDVVKPLQPYDPVVEWWKDL